MFSLSKRWMMAASIGQGVLFSLALTGAVRLACLLVGLELSEHVAGNLFFVSSLLTGALCAYLYSRSLKDIPLKP
jgi:hypothetical protein